ncbi:MAG: hypothetical protein NVS4B8_20810 [Herpetosiphon sp.]
MRPEHRRSLIGRCGAAGLVLVVAGGCGIAATSVHPTSRPVILVTPAPTQDIAATATAYVQRGVPTPVPPNEYVVRPGDTLTRIANDHETTVDELMADNNLSDPNRIEVGQRLRLPATTAGPRPTPRATPSS